MDKQLMKNSCGKKKYGLARRELLASTVTEKQI